MVKSGGDRIHIFNVFEKENENHDNDRIVCSTGKARRRCDDGGAIKAEVGKLNVESKERREAKEKAARQEAEPSRNRNDSIGVGED